jgi:hypothetical protein
MKYMCKVKIYFIDGTIEDIWIDEDKSEEFIKSFATTNYNIQLYNDGAILIRTNQVKMIRVMREELR